MPHSALGRSDIAVTVRAKPRFTNSTEGGDGERSEPRPSEAASATHAHAADRTVTDRDEWRRMVTLVGRPVVPRTARSDVPPISCNGGPEQIRSSRLTIRAVWVRVMLRGLPVEDDFAEQLADLIYVAPPS